MKIDLEGRVKKGAVAVVHRAEEDLSASEASRKLANHRKLIAAARKLFSKHGYHKVTTRDIAKEAGVVQGTFYSHFKDKTECYIALIHDVDDEICQLLEFYSPPYDSPPHVMIHSWATVALGYSRANPDLIKMVSADVGVMTKAYKRHRKMLPLHRKWIDLFDMWKATGQAAPDFDSYFFSRIINDAIKSGDLIVARDPSREKDVVNEITQFLLRAIKADK